jgi:PAS domain S-box-containing protein
LSSSAAAELARYRDLFENAPCGYLVLNMDGTVVGANKAALDQMGVAPDGELVSFRRLLTSAGAIFYDTQILPALLLSGSRSEIALDLRSGTRRIPVLANFSVEYDAGVPFHIRVILFHAAERRLFERDLLRSRNEAEQLSEVILHSSDAIITMQSDGCVRNWNNGASDMFGYSSAEARGVRLPALILSEADTEKFEGAISTLKGGRELSWETSGRHRNGSMVEISIKLTPHMEAPGTLVAFSAIVRDVSRQKLAERALLQSEKLASVGRLASSIAHEINNPLAAVTNLLYLIHLQAETPELKELAETAQEELARVSQITNHTLRFHRQSSKPTNVDLDALIGSVLVLYRARLRNYQIATATAICKGTLLCHDGELRQIVLNIVGNAIDAMKLGGVLSLRCRLAKDWRTGTDGIRLTIADSGTGMSAATAARIFEPFFTTKGIGGTGLGLWVTDDLVRKNRGKMKLRSSMSDRHHGTVFALFFAHAAEMESES